MEETRSRLALTDYLVSLINNTPATIIDKVVYLIQGKLRPDYEGIELGIAEKMIIRALSRALSVDISSIVEVYRQTGDLGDAARKILSSKKNKTTTTFTVEHIYSTLEEIARTSGAGSQELKVNYIVELLNHSTAREARYIIKFIMGTLRLGIADYTVMDALAIAFTGNKSNRKILEGAYNVCSDLGTVAKVVATRGIEAVKSIQITLFKPIRPMLAERVRTAQEALSRMEGGIAAAEYKLDGERIQVHIGKGLYDDGNNIGDGRSSSKVELFSRRLEKITHQYPDVTKAIVSSLKKIATEAIFESEVVAIDPHTLELRPFQELMHRRRKHNIDKAIEQYPVRLNIFDVLYLDGNDKTSLPYSQRREILERIMQRIAKIKATDKDNKDKKKNTHNSLHNSNSSRLGNNYTSSMIQLISQTLVKSSEEIENYMSSAIESGCEGLVLKQLNSIYKAGSRGYLWTKLKREYRSELADTLDLVIVGGLYGRGRRVGKYGALLLACYDHEADIFRSISKVGAGFTDIHLEDFYKNLEKHRIEHVHPRVDTITENMDVWFEPSIVIEVIASEITVSSVYSAAMNSIRKGYGLALRFPKFTGKIRDDKSPEDATTVEEIVKMYKDQIRKFNQ
ncbi:MAG: ATP-dependent DNA ligase [Thermoproteota archaeon]|nr:ATP-dependent DNA ligase [Thermoproteota archaeon]